MKDQVSPNENATFVIKIVLLNGVKKALNTETPKHCKPSYVLTAAEKENSLATIQIQQLIVIVVLIATMNGLRKMGNQQLKKECILIVSFAVKNSVSLNAMQIGLNAIFAVTNVMVNIKVPYQQAAALCLRNN